MIAIVLGSGAGFPNGTAPTARTLAYARGLRENGERVLVLCTTTSERLEVAALNLRSRGTFEGIDFEYTTGSPMRGASFPRRRLQQLRGQFVACRRLIAHRTALSAILLYPETLMTTVTFRILARLCNCALLLEKSELPEVHHGRNRWTRALLPIYERIVYRQFDGIIVISQRLRRYFEPLIRRDASLLTIPILVDARHFDASDATPGSGGYIAYCGTLNEQKDGVVTLMRAYTSIAPGFPGVGLVLIGDSYGQDMVGQYRAIALELGIVDRVTLTGMMPRSEIPAYLIAARALALARPTSAQADAGFPTKLGEYLATGNPVVTTRTGEIDRFLDDGVSAYFAVPDSVEAFARRLGDVLSDPVKAREVGARGKEIAEQEFNPAVNCGRLLTWVRDLKVAGKAPG